MLELAQKSGVSSEFIQPGKPSQNEFSEAFNGRVRDEFLYKSLLLTLWEARLITKKWEHAFNTEQPHVALNWATQYKILK